MSGSGRILHAVKRLGAPSETFVLDLMAELDGIGWEAWVASEWSPSAGAATDFPPASRVLRPQRPSRPRQVHARLRGLPARRRSAQWWVPIVREVSPALVYAHFGFTAARVALERLGPPVIVAFHGSDVRAWPHASRSNRAMYDEMLAGLKFAVCSSRSVADELGTLGYGGRVEVIHPGVRLERFPYRPPDPARRARRLLFVGRQVPCKGLAILLAALPEILRSHPQTSLRVVGDGPDAAQNVALAETLGISRQVDFLGAQEHAAVARELSRADILVVPSLTSAAGEAEGHPVAPKEAFATGVPVVATSCGGLPEVMPPWQLPELVPEGSPDALARAVVALLDRPLAWPLMSARAREWAEREFDSRKLVRRSAAFVEEVVASSGAVDGRRIQGGVPARA